MNPVTFQSTHPTRGCDSSKLLNKSIIAYFNPRTPRGGATLSSRLPSASLYFNPRTPRGGATLTAGTVRTKELFQSTHPTRGCDFSSSNTSITMLFQSTHPTRGCDVIELGNILHNIISIHAPHEGVRLALGNYTMRGDYFNPRTPRGGATDRTIRSARWLIFQSTHPTRGCDTEFFNSLNRHSISIHAPHEGVRP